MTPVLSSPLLLCVWLGIANAAQPSEAPPSEGPAADDDDQMFYPVRIVVDASELEKEQAPDGVERTRDRLTWELGKMLREGHRINVVEDPEVEAAELVIHLSWKDYMGSDYYVSIEVRCPDGREEPPIEWECTDCIDVTLVDRTYERAPQFLAMAQRPVETTAPDEETPTAEATEPEAEPAPRRRRGMMIAGYTAVGLGGAAIIGGAIAWSRPLRVGDDQPRFSTSHKPLGIGLVVGGGITLATGIALVVADAVRCKRSGRCKDEPTPSRTSLHPWLSPTTAGVGLRGSF